MEPQHSYENLQPTPRYVLATGAGGSHHVVVDSTTGMLADTTMYTDQAEAWNVAEAMNLLHYASTVPALQAQVGQAGWGVPNPAGSVFLSDGYDTAEDAITAAHAAWVYINRDGMSVWDAAQLAAQVMQDSELGEYSDFSKELTGSRCRSTEGLRHYRARAWEEQYLRVRMAQVQQAAAAA